MVKRLMVKTGEYQKDGQTKGRYTEVGVIMSNDKGEYVLLDPAVSLAGVLAQQNAMTDRPRDRVMVSVFENDNQRGGNSGGGNQRQQGGGNYNAPAGNASHDVDDEIPF